MKELTIEQKAKRYDEALKCAKSALDCLADDYICNHLTKDDIRGMYVKFFPELKESEDERVRKELVAFVKSRLAGFPECDRFITWLEKQGEQNYKIIKGKNYFCVKTHNYAGIEWIKGIKYYASDNYTLVNQGCECYCPEYSKEEHNSLFEEVKYDGCVEKQCGKKPADKVEPKFKAGNKVLVNGKVYTIKFVNEDNYIVDENGRLVQENFSYTKDWKLYEENNVWNEKDETALGDALWAIQQARTIAKNENDMGNLWYAEQCLKSLKGEAILLSEQQPVESVNGDDYGIDGLWHAQRILEKTLGNVEGYQSDDGILEHKAAIEAVKSLYEQKPAEWSEEDERIYQSILDDTVTETQLCDEQIAWLKSLRLQKQYKPSEEHLHWLKWAINRMPDTEKANEAEAVLEDLLEQLNKLMKE